MKQVLEKIFPVFCIICFRKGKRVCSTCSEQILFLEKAVVCSFCLKRKPVEGLFCMECRDFFGNIKLDILFDTSSQILKLIQACIAGSSEVISLFSRKMSDFILKTGRIPASIVSLSSERFAFDWIFALGKSLSKNFVVQHQNTRIFNIKKLSQNIPQSSLVIGESFSLFATKHRDKLLNLSENVFSMVFIH